MNGIGLAVAAGAVGFLLWQQNQQQQQQQQQDEGPQEAACPESYALSADGTQCELVAGQQESACPEGYTLNPEGTACELLSQPGDGANPLDINTGSAIGDTAALIGIGIGSSIIFDRAADAGLDTAKQAAEKAAREASEKAAKEAAEAAAAEAAEKVARETAERLAKEGAEKAAQEAAQAAAKAAAVKSARIAAQASKTAATAAKGARAATLLTKLKGSPFDLIITIIAQVLIAVLDINPESFEGCRDGEFDLSSLPDWAQAIISSVPFAGSLFDLFAPVLCFKGGCDDGYENQNGLCYPPAQPGWNCEAFLCYKQYPEWEANGMLHTPQLVVKNTLMDTGTVPTEQPAGTVKSGELFYKDPGPDYDVVAGVAYERCRDGFTDTGLRCEDIRGGGVGTVPPMKGCPEGYRDDGLTCFKDLTCRTWCDGDRDLFGNCYAWNLKTECSGPELIGKLSQGCDGGKESVDGLCYEPCPAGYSRVPGAPNICSRSYAKATFIIPPQSGECPADKELIAGLCYAKDIPAGYSRKVLGTLDQTCPPGAKDAGGVCLRETYERGAGKVPLNIKLKSRRAHETDTPAPSCEELAGILEDPTNPTLCRRTVCGPDEELSADGAFCVARCKATYTDYGQTCSRDAGTRDPITGEALPADSYPKRSPRAVIWGTGGDTMVPYDGAPPAASLSVGASVRLAHAANPAGYLRHYQFQLLLDTRITGPLGVADSTFKVIGGNDGAADTVSLQSSNFPDRYVRMRDWAGFIQVPDGTAEWAGDTSFRVGVNADGTSTLESVGRPGMYLGSTGGLVAAPEGWIAL